MTFSAFQVQYFNRYVYHVIYICISFFLLSYYIFILSLLPRYYFAVVECDSSATANYIYKECDGLELKQSSNALDLRFIPDNMEFKHPPRDVATEVFKIWL